MVLGGAAPAAADPAGPTDYRSEVVSVRPATDAVELRFIGGDSFLEMSVAPGHEALVIGYRGEPYLRFGADGTVEENTLAPTRIVNEDRYGEVELPPDVDADAEPVWNQVADGGTFAWHDHRTHWMNRAHPPGASPGDQILEAVVPLVVDGTEVDVTVASYWVAGPGGGDWAAVIVVAAAAAIGVLVLPGLWRWLPLWTTAVLATVMGVFAYTGVPRYTGPPLTLWVLPVAALVALAIGTPVHRWADRQPGLALARDAFAGLAGAELLLWGLTRTDALSRAIIPSDAPAALDRVVIGAAIAAGTAAAAQAAVSLLRNQAGALFGSRAGAGRPATSGPSAPASPPTSPPRADG
jgi:hypothetical protein